MKYIDVEWQAINLNSNTQTQQNMYIENVQNDFIPLCTTDILSFVPHTLIKNSNVKKN